ncbi:MAG: hypothetical protein IKS07_04940 [Lachnospiraceae bacterium]|nr:hypothetical protein [Lachnospiraceae bacterium]
MREALSRFLEFDNMVNIISCAFTVLALVFTLYFWLIDHLSDEEAEFVKKREETLERLRACQKQIDESPDADRFLSAVREVNRHLEIIVHYRFWGRSKQREEYAKIKDFYEDSRYLVSTILRWQETAGEPQYRKSLVGIPVLRAPEIDDIRTDYRKGLNYIIEFMENWS